MGEEMSETNGGDESRFVLPTYCLDPKCGAYLAGSWTKHTDDCEIGKLIREFIDNGGKAA